MGLQHGEGQATKVTEVALYPLLERSLRIGKTLIGSVAVDRPRAIARTDRTQSFELIFAKLDRRDSPESSRLIKALYLGLHDATASSLLTNVPHPRYHYNLQRYRIGVDC